VLVARRQELGLTQTDLADLAGVARGPVVALEAGRLANLEVLLAVLQVLGLHLELVRGTSTREVAVSDELRSHYDLETGDAPRQDSRE
jgi:DNA-binding XRE family transcriptional regulator